MIQISNVIKQYPTRQGPRTVLDNINLTINAGEKIGILGRNGSGKSTLIRLISGAEQPTAGSIQPTGRRQPMRQQPAMAPKLRGLHGRACPQA